MARQFIVTMMNLSGLLEYRINCANAESAVCIAQGIFGKHRVIDVRET